MKSKVKSELKPGNVWIDIETIKSKMETLPFKKAVIAKKSSIALRSLDRYLFHEQMPLGRLIKLSETLGVKPIDLQPLTKTQRARLMAPSLPAPHDWEAKEVVAAGSKAANGLVYEIYRLQSTLVQNSEARGKFYKLNHVSPQTREELVHCLQRHAVVCESLDSPHIAKHRATCALDGNLAWWVLDRWVDGRSLESLLEDGKKFSNAEVLNIGQQILLGLAELHRCKIIARELATERIIYNEQKESVVLTDFEMAKLMDQGVPSVSGRWKHNSPYRAPEVIDDIYRPRTHSLSFRSDLFSWAVIMIELLTGSTQTTPSALRDKIENTRWAELLIKCSNMAASKRPASVEMVLQQWTQVRD